MKAIVDQETCIGCCLCADMCPEIFRMEDNSKAYAFTDDVPEGQEECAVDAAENCPVEAISVD